MTTINEFIRQFALSRNIAIQSMVDSLGYKSKTSIDRILSGNAGIDALSVFRSRLESVYDLIGDEQKTLDEIIACTVYGPDRANAFRELHDMLCHRTSRGYADFGVSSGIGDEFSLCDYIKQTNIRHLKIYNCSYSPFFDVIRTLLRDTDISIEHFIALNGSETMLVRGVAGVLDLMTFPNYKAYSHEKTPDDSEAKGILLADMIIAYSALDNNISQLSFIIPDSMQHGRLIELHGDSIPLPEEEEYKPLNRTCPAASSIENFVGFCNLLSEMESNCATYDLKPDICVMYIPFRILSEAYMTSNLPQGFYEGKASAAIKAIFEKRVLNTYTKRKPSYAIMSPEALRQFARTGMTSDHMPGLRAFTVDERIGIFEQLLKACKTNPWFEIYLRRDDSLADYNICCYAGRGLFMALKDSDYLSDHSPEIILTPPASFYKLFETYYREELIRNHCYTAAESRDMIAAITNDLRGIG